MGKFLSSLLLYLPGFFCIPVYTFCQANLFSKNVSANSRQLADSYSATALELRIKNPDSAIVLAEKALQLSEQAHYPEGIIRAHLSIGFANSVKSNYDLLHSHVQKAGAIATEIGHDSLFFVSEIGMGSYYYNQGTYPKAVEHLLKAIKGFEKLKSNSGIIKAQVLLAQVYQVKGDIGKSVSLLQQTMKLPGIDPRSEANILHTLANIYGMENKLDSALDLDKRGLALCDAHNMDFIKTQFYDNMANCYMYSGKYALAEEYFSKCIQMDSAFENKKQMADTYVNLGELYNRQHNYTNALTKLNRAIELGKLSGYKQAVYQAYLLLSKTYSSISKNDRALWALQQAYQVKDSIVSAKTENRIAELETLYQTEKKEQEIQLKEVQLSRKNYLITGLLALTALIGLSFTSVQRRRQWQNKLKLQQEIMHQQELATKAVLDAEEKERERIAKDLHDGVGQMMSAAKMNLSAFESRLGTGDKEQKPELQKIIQLVDDSCREVRSVSHNMMPNALTKKNLPAAIHDFINKIDQRTLRVQLHCEGMDQRLSENTETILYRVIQECVNNTIKHAEASQLDISLVQDTNGIDCIIEDNGKGYDSGAPENSAGLGIKNISTRIQYLKGTVEFDSSAGRGTVVAIHVPV